MTLTNKRFSMLQEFINVCERANVKPTKRQASKFKMKKGRAYKSTQE